MATTMRNVLDICRLCLCHNGLIPLPQATGSLLTIEDIAHFTGIQITNEEQQSLSLCDKCCKVLGNSVAFRSTCLDNDIIFKQLISVVLEDVKDDAEENESTGRMSVEPLSLLSENQLDATEHALSGHESADEIEAEFTPFDDNASSTSESEDSFEMMVAPTNKNPLKSTGKKRNTSAPLDGNKKQRPKYKHRKKLCDTCGKLVTGYKEHVNEYHNFEKKYTCPHCPAKMRNRMNMRTHILRVHEKRISKTCEFCGTGFIHMATFLRHMASKHGIGKKYECKICSKSFGRDAYSYHMNKWHKAAREVTCTICSKTCSSRQMLRKHLRVHSTDQPYACSLCPKRFKTSTGKKGHELTHTGIRFSCNLCGKSYRYKSLLSMHQRKDHGGVTPSEAIEDREDV